MTLGHQQLHNILVPVSSGDINNKLFIVSINDEEEEFEDDDDPDYSPESDEGYRTASPLANSSCSPGSAHHRDSVIEEALITGTVGEATEDEHGNLMWLVDFKLDFVSDIEKGEEGEESLDSDQPERKKMKTISETAETKCQTSSEESVKTSIPGRDSLFSAPAFTSLKPHFLPRRQISTAKPNYTYTDLISLALRDRTSLTVSEIYQWIR